MATDQRMMTKAERDEAYKKAESRNRYVVYGVIAIIALFVVFRLTSMASEAKPEPMAGVGPGDIVVNYHRGGKSGGN